METQLSRNRKLFGVYPATVVNDVDPENSYRIRVRCASLGGDVWAAPSARVSAFVQSAMTIPAKASEVSVMFELGDPDRPMWMNAMPSKAIEATAYAIAAE